MSKGKKKDKGKKKPSGEFTPHPSHVEDVHAKQDAEVARQWAHRTKQDYRIEDPLNIAADLIVDEPEPEREVQPVGKPEPTAPPAPEVDSLAAYITEQGQKMADAYTKAIDQIILEMPADPVLENGNGQPVIHYLDPVTGKEKVKGYTRVTTYIDVLDDKTVLNKWKLRTLLEGAALEYEQDDSGDGGSVAAIGRAVKRLDDALADIDRRESVEGELLELRRQELIAEHRKYLDALSENLLDIGGAHDKATKGTNLHRLTEIVDAGHPLPDDTSASDRRDVEAYQAKMTELGAEVLWLERRIVLDDIQVSGTMDRGYLIKLPGHARRIRVVGDLKTGSVSWGQGKIGMQLALYARGLGYDWTKPLERTPLRLSKAYGLLIHLPQGEGRCDVFVVDLELAAKGLDLARQVREFRNAGKRVYDLKKPLGVEA